MYSSSRVALSVDLSSCLKSLITKYFFYESVEAFVYIGDRSSIVFNENLSRDYILLKVPSMYMIDGHNCWMLNEELLFLHIFY